jgi:hypothetical protein
VTKRRNGALSLASPCGAASTWSRPSLDIQLFFSAGGSV